MGFRNRPLGGSIAGGSGASSSSSGSGTTSGLFLDIHSCTCFDQSCEGVPALSLGSARVAPGKLAAILLCGSANAVALGAGSNANAEANTACAACAVSWVMAGTGVELLVEAAPVRANMCDTDMRPHSWMTSSGTLSMP